MLDVYDTPEFLDDLLDFTNEVSFTFAKALIKEAKMPIVAIGEALCSPDFISPYLYKEKVAPRHKKLVQRLHAEGLPVVLVHICGNVVPIFQTLIENGFDTADIDTKADLEKILIMAKGIGLRGNIDPAWILKAKSEEVLEKSKALLKITEKSPWILSSGCDVPLGTPDENIKALVEAAKTAL